jgi:hypothetical protein
MHSPTRQPPENRMWLPPHPGLEPEVESEADGKERAGLRFLG